MLLHQSIKKFFAIAKIARSLYATPELLSDLICMSKLRNQVIELCVIASQYASILEGFATTAQSEAAAYEAAFLRRKAKSIRKKLEYEWRF